MALLIPQAKAIASKTLRIIVLWLILVLLSSLFSFSGRRSIRRGTTARTTRSKTKKEIAFFKLALLCRGTLSIFQRASADLSARLISLRSPCHTHTHRSHTHTIYIYICIYYYFLDLQAGNSGACVPINFNFFFYNRRFFRMSVCVRT